MEPILVKTCSADCPVLLVLLLLLLAPIFLMEDVVEVEMDVAAADACWSVTTTISTPAVAIQA